MGRYKKYSKRKSSAIRLMKKERQYIPPKRTYTPNIIPKRSTRSKSRNIISSMASMYLEKSELSTTESSPLNSPKRRGRPVGSGSLGSSRNVRDRQQQHTRETNSPSPQKRSVRFDSPSDKGTPNRGSPVLVVSPLVSSSSPKPTRVRRSSSSSIRRQDPPNSATSPETRTNSRSKLRSETADFSPHNLRTRVPCNIFDTSFASMDEDSYVDDHRPQHIRVGRDGTKRSSQLPVSPKQQQQVETRQQLASRKRRFTLTDSVDAVPESPDSAGAAAIVGLIKRSCPQRRLLSKASADDTEIDRDAGDEASDEGDEEVGEDKQPDGRRYPIRARRHTAVYQVESNTHSNHAPHRNWLSGTGFEHYRRRNRYKSHRHLEHCGSSTPSSGDSSGGDSSSDASSPTRQKPRWCSRQPNGSHRRHPASASPLQVDTDEVRFARRCTKSLLNARSELLPINMNREDAQAKSSLSNRLLSGSSLADIEPMSIDDSVGFEQVGGHEKHIESLKECILLPLMYPEVFTQFGIEPPRGVLFSGPPGTGKTLLARALANECGRLMEAPVNTGNSRPSNAASPPPAHRQIAFFMRKGADCLSKWVGESERQLRLLFDQAYRMRPSIIFFDEIDGLAPVRSSRQDQIHSSIVSTLLSLMDGLDNRAEVVIIGATNRPDAIDPALRRPGRFDREFVFQLPAGPGRQRILKVHTAKWQPKVGPELLKELAQATNNFSGADLKALVTEACLCCLRRRYPQVYSSQVKLALDRKCLVVTRSDWLYALRLVRPSNDRSDVDCAVGSLSPSASALASTRRCPLQPKSPVASLLTSSLDRLTKWLVACLYPDSRLALELNDDGGGGGLGPRLCSSLGRRAMLLHGDVPPGLMAAVWHRLESAQIFTLNFTNLIAFPTSVGICPEAAIAQIVSTVRRAVISAQATTTASNVDVGGLSSLLGVIVYLPCVDSLLAKMPRQTSTYLVDRLVGLLHASSSQEQHRQQSGEEEQPQPLLLVATLRRYRKTHLPADAEATENTGRPLRQPSRASAGAPLVNGLPMREPASTRSDTLGSAALALNGVRSVSTPATPVNTTTARNTQVNGELPGDDGDSDCSSSASSSSSSTSTMDFSFSSGTDSDHSGLPAFQAALNNSSCCSCRYQTTKESRSAASLVRFLVRRLFPPVKGTRLGVRLPDLPARRALFDSLIGVVFPPPPSSQASASTGHRRRRVAHEGRAPTPPPVSELLQLPGAGGMPEPSVTRRRCRQYSPAELLVLERQDAQLFRRLRQVLRRVVAHLARHRRFAVFTRPVQADEVPDYYEVIKQPMDLGAVRDKIDAHRYTDVAAFMQDIELIYRNALEYNPANVPRSREIRSRASEFWDEACLQLEEELHPSDLDEQCRAAMEAQAARKEIGQTCSMKSVPPTGNPYPAGGSTATVASSPFTKTPPPMPSGGRYSRRLHGENPVLAPADILQLAAVRSRRGRHSRSASMVSEEKQEKEKGYADAQPRWELDEDESNLSALFTDEAMSSVPPPIGTGLGAEASFGKSPSLSETVNNNSVLTADDYMVATAKPRDPVTTDHPSPGANPPASASSSDDASFPRNANVPPTGEPVWAKQPGFAAVDYRSLRDFVDRLARKTKGWNSDQLICLHRQLTVLCQHYRLRRQAGASSLVLLPGIRQLQVDLHRVYMDHRIREEFEHNL